MTDTDDKVLVPRSHVRLPKKLIICCDGTWQDSDNGWVRGSWGRPGHLQTPTNVTRICRAIKSEDDANHPQIVYYQAGVGTGIGLYDRLLGGGTGLGLSENIREAYAFLASNYSPQEPDVDPDSIFLIGFSRGAFTARSLGGFIGAVGVLSKHAMPYFYQCFLDWENAGDPKWKPMFIDAYINAHPEQESRARVGQPLLELAHDHSRIDEYMTAYRKHLLSLDLTQEVKIKCIGVWDTVGALGIPVNPIIQKLIPFLPAFIKEYQWFDTSLDNCIENAFQALALDEQRFPFSPSLWEKDAKSTTNLKQVWFPGAHSNIGGSYEDSGMANITLAWMMDQLAGNTIPPSSSSQPFRPVDWIKFDPAYLSRSNSHLSSFYSRSSPLSSSVYSSWGMGKLIDSNTFPSSFFLGRRIRRPGSYKRMDYFSGKPTSRFLQDTHERIHSCVRARIDLGGADVQPKSEEFGDLFHLSRLWQWILRRSGREPDTYLPQKPAGWLFPRGPLEGWRLRDGHESHREPNLNIDLQACGTGEGIRWEFVGEPGEAGTRVMVEDGIAHGGFEEMLALMQKGDGEGVLVSNRRWGFGEKGVGMEKGGLV